MKDMNNYILLIASVIVCCSLAAVLLMYLHCRRMKWNCNMMIAEYLRTNAGRLDYTGLPVC